MTSSLPLVIAAAKRRFWVIGGGVVAARKVKTLVDAGATVTVIAPDIHQDIVALSGSITLQQRAAMGTGEAYLAGDLVVLATDSEAVNAEQADAARAAGAWVCRTDLPADNDFSFPAVVDRGALKIAVSTSGSTPALTRLVRARLEAFIPQDYARLASWMESLRERVRGMFDSPARGRFWRRLVASQALDQVLARREDVADSIAESLLQGDAHTTGEAYLVGAGPGDPDLLTFRALRLIQSADIVFYDRLVNPAILEMVSPQCERIYVGKARSDHAVPQGDINRLLAEEALKGKRVLRLKGGDPFIFGRGGEEIEELSQSGVPFQVVPGITAASGCSAYAGIPLTHRDHAQSVRFVTGHMKDGTCNLPWSELIHPQQTLVIYMGLVGLPEICRQLIAHGMPETTPIALVEKGTLPDQQVHTGTLATMPDYVKGKTIQAPTLTIVGSVVSLHESLRWR